MSTLVKSITLALAPYSNYCSTYCPPSLFIQQIPINEPSPSPFPSPPTTVPNPFLDSTSALSWVNDGLNSYDLRATHVGVWLLRRYANCIFGGGCGFEKGGGNGQGR